MKILLISDEESKKYWDHFQKGMLDPYELILSCGDLSPEYLQFLVTMSKAELLYVHGNHDGKYDKIPPCGCIPIDGKLFIFNGIRILGLGGCMQYSDGPHQYTPRQMEKRIRHLLPKIRLAGGVDILLTHAPAEHINDGSDPCHRGFSVFRWIMERYRPHYFIHGHMHRSYGGFRRLSTFQDTTVINACGAYELDYPDELLDRSKNTKRKWKTDD